MAQLLPRQSAISLPGMSRPEVNAAQLAAHLAVVAGAEICYLKLSGSLGQRAHPLVSSRGEVPTAEQIASVGPLFRRIRGRSHPLAAEMNGKPVLACVLEHEGHSVGSVLLIYDNLSQVNVERACAAALLVAQVLDTERQVDALHIHAEEIEARAHVREIQISRNLLRGVIDSVPMGLVLLDADAMVLAANRALAERFGLDPSLLVGMPYGVALGNWEDSPTARSLISAVPEKQRRRMIDVEGREVLLEINSFPLLDGDGLPRQAVEVWEDITERVTLQTQLVRVEKLAAIGQLAASIAHEVGNPLQAIQGFLSLFLEQAASDVPNRRFLELAEDEIERIVSVLARLRDLYRPKVDTVVPVNVNELVEYVLLLTNKQLEHNNIRVVRDLMGNMPEIMAVADQLKQVLLNLVLNAVDAMRNNGQLSLRTSVTQGEGGEQAVVIAITDNGHGIPAEQLPRIFDGLYTSKERGMGLGLYTSKAIIDRHMGRIVVESRPGSGTTFTITLPVRAKETPE